jgi:integrase
MKDNAEELDVLAERALGIIEKSGISPLTIKTSYRAPFGRIKRFCDKLGKPFSEEMLEDYVMYIEQFKDDGTWTKAYYNLNRHAALFLLDCARTEDAVWHQYRKGRHKHVPSEGYIELAEEVISFIGEVSNSHATRTRRYLRQFFCYMEEVGIKGCGNIDNRIIRKFIVDVAEKQPKEASYIIYSIRMLLGFLAEKGICHVSINATLYSPSIKSSATIPSFTRDEIRAMLDAIDVSAASGKRNKAIILLAITTGLRGCDIAGMRLGDIGWTREEIRIIQKKTLVPIDAPLIPAAGNALTDYLLNGRPQSKDSHVFLSLKAPYRPITSAGSFGVMLNGICKTAGVAKIKRRAFHSLRRSTGTWMAETGTPIETIAQVLGHASIRSSMPYTVFDPTTLDACPLDFSIVPLTKGGVYGS